MTVNADLTTILEAHAGLSALVGDRIHSNKLPQGETMPCITYRRISSTRISAMVADTGTVRAIYQYDVWATGYDSMRAVTEQLRQALQRYQGTDTVEIEHIFVNPEIEFYEDETELHHCAIDFEVIYKEG